MQKKSSSSVKIFYPKFNKANVIRMINEKLPALKRKLPLTKVILFGSYSKMNYTVTSDIDVLVVYRKKYRKDDYAIVKKVLNIPQLQPHVYNEKEYNELKGIIDKMTKDGIVIFTISPP